MLFECTNLAGLEAFVDHEQLEWTLYGDTVGYTKVKLQHIAQTETRPLNDWSFRQPFFRILDHTLYTQEFSTKY